MEKKLSLITNVACQWVLQRSVTVLGPKPGPGKSVGVLALPSIGLSLIVVFIHTLPS